MGWVKRIRNWFDLSDIQSWKYVTFSTPKGQTGNPLLQKSALLPAQELGEIRLPTSTSKENPFRAALRENGVRRVKPWPPPPPSKRPIEADGYFQQGGGI